METKHLEFIEAIISRLAGNSFQMKTWNVALATAAVGFAAAKDSRPTVAVIAIVPALAFWFLDAYYLGLEELYRSLYKKAVSTNAASFNLDAGTLGPSKWLSAISRPSVAGLHMPMVGVILLVSLTGVFR
jgi:hypothetical protein